MAIQSDAQDQLADLSTNNKHRVIDATHAGLVDDEVTFEPSVQAIVDVVKSHHRDPAAWVVVVACSVMTPRSGDGTQDSCRANGR